LVGLGRLIFEAVDEVLSWRNDPPQTS
jgi:hypothetical protein